MHTPVHVIRCARRGVCVREQGGEHRMLFPCDEKLSQVAISFGQHTGESLAFKTHHGIDMCMGVGRPLSDLARLPDIVGDGTVANPHVVCVEATGGLSLIL